MKEAPAGPAHGLLTQSNPASCAAMRQTLFCPMGSAGRGGQADRWI